MLHVLLIFIILGIVAFTGYFVWQSQQAADTNIEKSIAASESTPTPKKTPSAESLASNDYLVIKEWGVKMKIPSGMVGATYGRGMVTGGDVFVISTSKGEEIGGSCTVKAVGLGWVERSKSMIKVEASPPIPINNEQPINGHYYYYHSPQAACSDASDPTSTEWPEVLLVKQLINTLESAES